MPEAGEHCKVDGRYVPLAAGETCASGDSIEISQDNGRDLYTNWTDEYYYKATRMGTFWDKYIALWSMTYNPRLILPRLLRLPRRRFILALILARTSGRNVGCLRWWLHE